MGRTRKKGRSDGAGHHLKRELAFANGWICIEKMAAGYTTCVFSRTKLCPKPKMLCWSDLMSPAENGSWKLAFNR